MLSAKAIFSCQGKQSCMPKLGRNDAMEIRLVLCMPSPDTGHGSGQSTLARGQAFPETLLTLV